MPGTLLHSSVPKGKATEPTDHLLDVFHAVTNYTAITYRLERMGDGVPVAMVVAHLFVKDGNSEDPEPANNTSLISFSPDPYRVKIGQKRRLSSCSFRCRAQLAFAAGGLLGYQSSTRETHVTKPRNAVDHSSTSFACEKHDGIHLSTGQQFRLAGTRCIVERPRAETNPKEFVRVSRHTDNRVFAGSTRISEGFRNKCEIDNRLAAKFEEQLVEKMFISREWGRREQ
jgi:hypothetical protein